uniref:D-arabinono-1,4-lactone oxidase n=1 Tax=Marseillevirus LCMAC201 TaxID=2506605 RepID=A0A481YX68_9VIRU|nr:MAG: D-arabinono-1,4-lactone oxidase [Marseillevirus LCMAC201]
MKGIIIIYTVLLVLVLWLANNEYEFLKTVGSDTDYALQSWIYDDSDKNWHRAHNFMYETLSKHSYITFDLRYKAEPKYTFIPGKLVKFTCKNLTSRTTEIKKAWLGNIKDLQEIVKKHDDGVIRASGGHHTFNDISITQDTMIRTFNLKNVLNIDKKNKQITVESGILLQDLNLCLADNNLALHVLPAIPFQSLGGVLSTSSHGSRWDMGSMSQAIVGITMIIANGSVRTFTKKDPEFTAVQVNLGCLGVVHSYTVQCVDLYAIEHTKKKMLWSDVLGGIDEYLNKYLFFQCYIKPDRDDLQTTVYLRKKVNPKNFTEKELSKDRTVSVKKLDHKVDYGMYVLTKNQEASHYTEIEIAVPAEVFPDAIKDTIQLIKSYRQQFNWNYGRSILIRFTGADTGLLSMTSGRESVFINIFQPAKNATDPLVLSLFRDFQNLLTSKYFGRPHWGKYNEMTPELTEKLYGKANFDHFNAVRKQLDPNGVFSNDYIKRALGDV